jgi:hypothetical protein
VIFIFSDIFAAGTALGHAGEWESFLDYLKSSYNARDLGQVRAEQKLILYVLWTGSHLSGYKLT